MTTPCPAKENKGFNIIFPDRWVAADLAEEKAGGNKRMMEEGQEELTDAIRTSRDGHPFHVEVRPDID